MARTLYYHQCNICKKEFESIKRIQKTCGYSCRGTYGRSNLKQKICKCGKLGNSIGNCPDCSLENIRKGRREDYYKHKKAILIKRKQKWNKKTPEEKLAITRQMKEHRFNGHRKERLELDKYTCQKCGNREQLIVHHIKHLPKGCKKDTWSTIDDLITWCRPCHINHHRNDLLS